VKNPAAPSTRRLEEDDWNDDRAKHVGNDPDAPNPNVLSLDHEMKCGTAAPGSIAAI
jgi:hypothetical protein